MHFIKPQESSRPTGFKKWLLKSHLDPWMLLGILALMLFGSLILYSASNGNLALLYRQAISFGLALGAMCCFAHVPTYRYQALVPWLYGLVLLLLFAVMAVGVINKGAQRWLNLGILRFQPSEIMKLATPMMLAWYLRDKIFPLHAKELFICCTIIAVPAVIIAKQPDLSTAILVTTTGLFVLLLAGITWRLFLGITGSILTTIPVLWNFMHPYQKARLAVFLSPEADPYGRGYNIIQSKIAVGSGGLVGKGWLLGTQTHLQFLPEHYTDFIFAVCGEEFGFLGSLLLLALLLFIVGRGLYISLEAQDTFSRLLAGTLSLTFFASFFLNICMVVGLVPVVGVPLPLVSYGGSSLVSFMSCFGIIMATKTHKKLIGS